MATAGSRRPAIVLATAALLTAGCAARPISHVLADPYRYHDRDVHVAGSVVDSYSLANQGVYAIDDGTGRLWVVTNRGTPRPNTNVSVRGTIRDAYNIGSLGDRMGLPPGVGSGLVMIESSREAEDR